MLKLTTRRAKDRLWWQATRTKASEGIVMLGPLINTMTGCSRRVGTYGVVAALVGCISCATAGQAPDRGTLDTAIRARASVGIRVEGLAPLPPDASMGDGLTSQEAVAIALWNSPSFQATLADLGIARADLVEAGLLRNPVFSLLFPVGPKQLEWTLQFPFDALWQRPRRVRAAQLDAQAVGERLVWNALALVAQTRTAHADALIAERRLRLTVENADLVQRLAAISDARLRAGDISELEARSARSDAARVLVMRQAVEHDGTLARLTLAAILGLATMADELRPIPGPLPDPSACGTEAARLEDALASRPDVRAAEIGVEAAAERARWERSRVVNLIGILDYNGKGEEGAEVGPGVGLDLPIFSRNQGGIGRADAEVERASRRYAAVRAQVVADVRAAAVRVRQAEQAIGSWRNDIVPSLEIEQRQAERAYQAGEIPLVTLLDASRRLVDGRTRLLDAEADLHHAMIALERGIGRSCGGR
jgi:cobalt-zinc-cadmium efflux system outer membrane protein